MDLAFDLAAFVDGITNELIMTSPTEIQAMVMDDERIQAEVFALQQNVRDGLQAILDGTGTVEELERVLKIRKTELVRLAPRHSYTVEKIVRGVSIKVVNQARELRPRAATG